MLLAYHLSVILPDWQHGYAVTKNAEFLYDILYFILGVIFLLIGPIASMMFLSNAGIVFGSSFLLGVPDSINKNGRLTSKGVSDSVASALVLTIALPIIVLLAGPVILYQVLLRPAINFFDGADASICCVANSSNVVISPSGDFAYLIHPYASNSHRLTLIDFKRKGIIRVGESSKTYWEFPDDEFKDENSGKLELLPYRIKDVDSIQGNIINVSGERKYDNRYNTKPYDVSYLGLDSFEQKWGATQLPARWAFNEFTSDKRIKGVRYQDKQPFDINVGRGGYVILVGTTGIAAVFTAYPFSWTDNWREKVEIDFWDVNTGKKITSRTIAFFPSHGSERDLKKDLQYLSYSQDGRLWVIKTPKLIGDAYYKLIDLSGYFEKNHATLYGAETSNLQVAAIGTNHPLISNEAIKPAEAPQKMDQEAFVKQFSHLTDSEQTQQMADGLATVNEESAMLLFYGNFRSITPVGSLWRVANGKAIPEQEHEQFKFVHPYKKYDFTKNGQAYQVFLTYAVAVDETGTPLESDCHGCEVILGGYAFIKAGERWHLVSAKDFISTAGAWGGPPEITREDDKNQTVLILNSKTDFCMGGTCETTKFQIIFDGEHWKSTSPEIS